VTESAPLVVNTKLANARLIRARIAPRGVAVENLEKTDQAVYRRFLRWVRLRAVQHMMSDERVSKCYRVRVQPVVKVNYVSKIKRAHYGGLVVCGGVWVCPVCSAKITERRRAELEGATDGGLSKFMVTYTIQHNKRDKLKALIGDLRAGIKDMKNSRQYKKLLMDLQIVGTVTALEVTISNVNGWHPHLHALMFSSLPQSKIKRDEIRRELSSLFVAMMSKRGRYVHGQIGVNVQSGKDIKREYLAKYGDTEEHKSTWSLSAELTKSPVKSGRDEDHFHPFELVDMYQAGNMEAGKRWMEYARAMKHKKQLVYTKGLRDRLGLDVELSDQEIAEREDQSAVLFAELSVDDWKHVIRHEKRGQLLEVASTGNYNKFVTWMRAIGRDGFGENG